MDGLGKLPGMPRAAAELAQNVPAPEPVLSRRAALGDRRRAHASSMEFVGAYDTLVLAH